MKIRKWIKFSYNISDIYKKMNLTNFDQYFLFNRKKKLCKLFRKRMEIEEDGKFKNYTFMAFSHKERLIHALVYEREGSHLRPKA